MPAAFFVVRATVTDPAKREAFDAWYSREHLPDAMKSFGAAKAWRYWSATDPSLHHAMYQFTDKAALERATEGPEMKRLVADFNRAWPDVTRGARCWCWRRNSRRNTASFGRSNSSGAAHERGRIVTRVRDAEMPQQRQMFRRAQARAKIIPVRPRSQPS
jgi:hypothetical protein